MTDTLPQAITCGDLIDLAEAMQTADPDTRQDRAADLWVAYSLAGTDTRDEFAELGVLPDPAAPATPVIQLHALPAATAEGTHSPRGAVAQHCRYRTTPTR